MRSTEDQIIDRYLFNLVSYCIKKAVGEPDEHQAFKDALAYQIQVRVHEVHANNQRAAGASNTIRS